MATYAIYSLYRIVFKACLKAILITINRSELMNVLVIEIAMV